MFCSRCGTQSADRDAYCAACGASLSARPAGLAPAPSTSDAACAVCAVPGSGRYCASCGHARDLPAGGTDSAIVPKIRPLLAGPAWNRGALGAGVAVLVTLVGALLMQALAAPPALLDQIRGVLLPSYIMTPTFGMIYGMMHGTSLHLLVRATTGLGTDPESLMAMIHLPLLLGLPVVVGALVMAGRIAAPSDGQPAAISSRLVTGLTVAVPYALLSLITGFLGGVSGIRAVGREMMEGRLGPHLPSLFFASLLLALLCAALGAGSGRAAEPTAGASLARYRPHLRLSVRALGAGILLTLLLASLMATFSGAGTGVRNSFVQRLATQTSPLPAQPLRRLDGAGSPLLIRLPIALVQAHGLGQMGILAEDERMGRPDADRRSYHLFAMPKGTPARYWLFLLVPLLVLPASGYLIARERRASGTEALQHGAIVGVLYGLGGLLLAALAWSGGTVAADGELLRAFSGLRLGSSLVPVLLFTGALGAAGGHLATFIRRRS
jgi:hypothetical protein